MEAAKISRNTDLFRGSARKRTLGSSVTFLLLLAYFIATTLKFQIRWLPVYVQLSLFLVIVLRGIGGLRTLRFTRTQIAVYIVLVVTLCVALIGQFIGQPGENLGQIPQVTRFLVIALACILELDTTARLNRALTVVMGTTAFISLLTIVNVFVPLSFAFTGSVRAIGPLAFGTPRSLGIWMTFGGFGVLASIGASYAGMSVFRPDIVHGPDRSTLGRFFSAVSLMLIVTGVLLGVSRSTLLAFFLIVAWALIVATFHGDERLRSRRPGIPLAIILSGVALGAIQIGAVLNEFIGSHASSVSVRIEQYRLATELMLQRPLFGWGWGYFEVAFGSGYTVHSLWFLLGVALGIPVFLFWIYVFVRLGLELLRGVTAPELHRRAYCVIGVGMFIGGTVELAFYPGFTPTAAVLIGILLGIQGVGAREVPT